MSARRIVLVLGGARSGKSVFAESLVEQSGLFKTYLATAQSFDSEMDQRIETHKARRSADWALFEEPIELTKKLSEINCAAQAILVDCLTLWVTNLMMANMDINAAGDRLAAILPQLSGTIVLVSNEVGHSIVPDNKMARAFVDHAGLLHQKIARVSDEVYFVSAGLPQKLKG